MRFDLVLCDIMMPGLSGLEVLSRLLGRCPETRVVMATGCATQDLATESLRKGAIDFVTKPYELDQLCGILDAAMARTADSGGEPS
jgi:DNA-binding NtrC family response regulator